jgi:RNase P/RNase MRP subunit p29
MCGIIERNQMIKKGDWVEIVRVTQDRNQNKIGTKGKVIDTENNMLYLLPEGSDMLVDKCIKILTSNVKLVAPKKRKKVVYEF